MSADGNEPRSWIVRLSGQAREDIDREHDRIASLVGAEIAEEWRDRLLDALATLALFPGRCPLIEERAQFRRDVRQLLYRRRPGSNVAHRVLFYLVDNAEDAPTVQVIHVRYAAADSISAAEATDMETDAEG